MPANRPGLALSVHSNVYTYKGLAFKNFAETGPDGTQCMAAFDKESALGGLLHHPCIPKALASASGESGEGIIAFSIAKGMPLAHFIENGLEAPGSAERLEHVQVGQLHKNYCSPNPTHLFKLQAPFIGGAP